jgi:ribosomal protein L37AE/L43A
MYGILGQRQERTSGTDRGELRILRFTKLTHTATIVCPSSLKEVSDKVIRCSNCGQPLAGLGVEPRINLEGTTSGTGAPEKKAVNAKTRPP